MASGHRPGLQVYACQPRAANVSWNLSYCELCIMKIIISLPKGNVASLIHLWQKCHSHMPQWDYLHMYASFSNVQTLSTSLHTAGSFLSPPPKLGGDIGMVASIRTFHRSGFLTIIWKSNHSFNVGICLVSVQKWFTFGRWWPNLGSLMAKND